MTGCARRLFLGIICIPQLLVAADVIPHAQDKPPNEPRDAATAAKMMTVPPGFVVEVVASEPDLVNPVAMAIDERGRFWITESLEYPRRSPGPGRDRVKILEDTDGDGAAETVKIFLDGLNIPSGVQVGHGGVWIANAPDILFVPDKDRDGVPDGPAEVVVTGFGRTDTHELPNSLTWGPDGWLYGLNGVFNHSHVKYSKTNPNYDEQHPGWPLTCAMFRIHPRTREFQVFCEGTSNPWGIAFNDEGDAFISACVIDHLWHLVETGYYHRQGGPYPPHTWKIESIVKHKHQKAAYCGITWFDSDAYPEQYNKKLYMGNIHGGCINVDRIERNGSTYAGFGEPDFLTANDTWFMPVVQKTGKDGCLYILDWYDRYHCYQDANRDPEGIDRLKGRLYRVKYTGDKSRAGGVSPLKPSSDNADPNGFRTRRPNGPIQPSAPSMPKPLPSDLATASDDELIDLLSHRNVWVRETAHRLIIERSSPEVAKRLIDVFEDLRHPKEQRYAMLQALSAFPAETLDTARFIEACAFVINNDEEFSPEVARILFKTLANRNAMGEVAHAHWFDETLQRKALPPVLEAAIAIGKSGSDQQAVNAWLRILQLHGNDPILQRVIWQNLKVRLAKEATLGLPFLNDPQLSQLDGLADFRLQLVRWLLAQSQIPSGTLKQVLASGQSATSHIVLQQVAAMVQSNEIAGDRLAALRSELQLVVSQVLKQPESPLFLDGALLAATWRQPDGYAAAQNVLVSARYGTTQRLAAANALIAAEQDEVLRGIAQIFEQSPPAPVEFRGQLLASLARLDDPEVAQLALHFYPQLEPDLQSKAIELLTQRPAWSKELLQRIGDKQIPATVLNVNQARRLAESKDESLRELLAKHWGTVREGRSPDRERIVAEMRAMIRKTPGDPLRGEAVFKKTCAQCHKMYGEGAEVGPDITNNGRNDYTQLLSNVFDPSLVIGSGYRSYTVATEDGRVLNGLLVEDSPQRVVLKVQGGKQEVIARDNIDVFKVSEISLMPEQLERQHTPQEIADLFAYITLDKPPTDPTAKRLPGVYDVVPRATMNPAEFSAIVQEVAPGFSEVRSGIGGVELLAEHKGRTGVVRTHPASREQPGVLIREITLPADKKAKLVVDVSHDPRGDWRLVAYVGSGGRMIDEIVDKKTCGDDGWATFTASLEKFAGQTVKITLRNEANDWAWEFGYWGSVRIEYED